MTKQRYRNQNKKEEFDSEVLDIARVTRVTAGGRRLRFRATVAIGDKKGKVGIGVRKAPDVAQAIEKAKRVAEKNLVEVPIKDETIPYEVEAKYGPSTILLKPQTKGRGLVAGSVVRTLCGLAGIGNVSSKIISRSKNKINNARATIKAFNKLKIRTEKSKEKSKIASKKKKKKKTEKKEKRIDKKTK